MSEIDQQFIEYVVKALVGKPDAVSIKRTIDEKGVLLELTVDPDDLGRVIGKRGATAQSLRTLLRALGTKNDARYNLKIIDNGEGGASASGGASGTEDKPKKSKPPTDDDNDSGDEEAGEKPDEKSAPEPAQEESAEEPADESGEDTADEDGSGQEEEASERLARTRRELADLDDLDV